MEPFPVSLVVVAYNEESNLGRCLASAADLVREIVVVDSGSSDRTVEIAKEFGAKVIHQDWLGFRDQKNVALKHCGEDWVLSLDADEALSPKLHESIYEFLSNPIPDEISAARCNRCVWFLGRWIRHGDWYPDTKTRLVRRDRARWGGSREHDRIELEGKRVLLEGDLQHFSFPNMSSYIKKINVFADLHYEREVEGGGSFSVVGAAFRSVWRFFRAYILRTGFLDGFPGLWIAVATGFHTFVRHTRIYESNLDSEIPPDSVYKTDLKKSRPTRNSAP